MRKLNLRKANFDSLNSALTRINFDHILSKSTCSQIRGTFHNMLPDLHSFYAPFSATCLHSYATLFTTEILNNIKLKHALQKTFRTSKNKTHLPHFKAMRCTVNSTIKIAHKKYLLSVENALSRGRFKPFWSHTGHFRNPTLPFFHQLC